jgi:hypothetical protein
LILIVLGISLQVELQNTSIKSDEIFAESSDNPPSKETVIVYEVSAFDGPILID